MKSLLFVLALIASINASGFDIAIEDHGFILNWITIQPSIANGISGTPVPVADRCRNFYIFAGYFRKLQAGEISVRLSLSLQTRPERKFEQGLAFESESSGSLLYKMYPLDSICSATKAITLVSIDSSVDNNILTVKAVIDCDPANGFEMLGQTVGGVVGGVLGKDAGNFVNGQVQDGLKDGLNQGLNAFTKKVVV